MTDMSMARHLEKEILYLQAKIQNLQSSLVYDPGTNAALLSLFRAQLEAKQEALERLSNGIYGFCQECGKPIEADRLKVLPDTAKCLACAKKGRRLQDELGLASTITNVPY